MIRLSRSFALVIALLFLTSLVAQAQTPEPQTSPGPVEGVAITIEGQISNATPGGSVPPNLPLMLHTYDGMHMADMLHGTADEQGRFRFENVANASGRTFAVMVNYGDVSYTSQRVEHMAGETQLHLPVSIYDTTTDPQAIQVEQQHLLLGFTPEAVRVTQLYILSNVGDRAVVDGTGTNPSTGSGRGLRFRLPAGATDVSFEQDEEGQRYVLLDTGFADRAPVAPGRSTQAIMVNYTLPYTGDDPINLEVPVDYPTAQTAVLLPEVGVTLDESQWTPGEELLIQDSVHQVYSYTGGTLKPGEVLHLVLAGQPQISATDNPDPGLVTSATAEVPGRDSRRPIFILGVTLSIMLIGSGTVWLRSLRSVQGWRDRRQETMPESAITTALLDSESEELESVLAAIAELDQAHEAGTISEAEYEERRAGLRDQAVTLMLAQKHGQPDDRLPEAVRSTAEK